MPNDAEAKTVPLNLSKDPPTGREKLVQIIRDLFRVDADLDLTYLLKLPEGDLEKLVACIRGRVENQNTTG